MAVNFATLIAHQKDTNYAAFANALAVGRPFRQPLQTASNANNFASGLEIFLSSAGDVAVIFSWLDGNVRWQASRSPGTGHRLILDTDPNALKDLDKLKMLEALPTQVVYENVDQAALQTALEQLLQAAYTMAAAAGANPKTWRPAMRMRISEGKKKITLKEYLDRHQPATTEINRLVTEFLAGATDALLQSIPVRASDALGRAAAYLATDPLPQSAPFPLGAVTDPARARRLTFITYDAGQQVINPLYYLHLFMRQMLQSTNRVVQSLTAIVANGALSHPLVTLYPALSSKTLPAARGQVNDQSRLPIGDLANFHGYPNDEPISRYEWHYADSSLFEARGRQNQNPVTLNVTPASKIQDIWNTYGNTITKMCSLLQIPCEIIIGLIGVESSGNERVVRLEPLLDKNRAALRDNAALEMAYDMTVGIRGTISNVVDQHNGTSTFTITLDGQRTYDANILVERHTRVLNGANRFAVVRNSAGSKARVYTITVSNLGTTVPADGDGSVLDGYDTTVPDPWDGASPVRSGRTLKWNELITVVNATRGQRISPGLMQTLISTARDTVKWLNRNAPDIFATLGIPAPPSTDGAEGAYLNDWLLHSTHSILLGAVKIRKGYNRHRTRFDLPLVGSDYNGGAPRKNAKSPWGLRYHGNYVETAAPYFNAAADLFNINQLPSPTPSVRFMR